MMTIEDENDEDSFVYKGMQQTVKAKVVNLLREKLEAQEQQDVSDGGSDIDENEHSDKLFNFLFKGSNETCRDSAVKIFERFVDQKPQRQICSSNFQNDALKNLFIRYNTALPSSAAVERVFSVGKDILKPKRAGLSDDHFETAFYQQCSSNYRNHSCIFMLEFKNNLFYCLNGMRLVHSSITHLYNTSFLILMCP